MSVGAPPREATAEFLDELERVRRLTGLQVNTLAHAVTDVGDVVGWDRLTELGTSATVNAQKSGAAAAARYAEATLEAAGVPPGVVNVPVQPGTLASGTDVRKVFAATEQVVRNRVAGGATFYEGLDSSAKWLTGIASSEAHRVGRDGLLQAGLHDDRFERFRRVAEFGACPFCRMLATRGAVYLDAGRAGESRRYHAHCRCHVELVVGAGAIEASRGLQRDWRNAIRDDQRLTNAGVMLPPPVAETATTKAAAFTAESAKRLTNADLEKRMTEAWDSADDGTAMLLEDEMERRNKWAQDWGRDYDEYDDWLPLDDRGLDDDDLPDFEDVPQRTLTRRQVQEEWEAEQETRYWDAEAYGGGIRPDLAAEARERGITLHDLMTGDPRTAYKYANQELLTWWDSNGGRMPLYERLAAHGHLDKRTTLAGRRLTEDKARTLAQELIGKDRREAMAARGAQQAATRRAAAGPVTEGAKLAAAQRRYQRARRAAQ